MNNLVSSVGIVGAGNVAHHLGHILIEKGIKVRWVHNRSVDKGRQLANKLHANFVEHIDALELVEEEVVFLCVSDRAIAEIAKSRNWNTATLVHTSGSFDTAQLQPYAKQYGAFYPFQTFRQEVAINWHEVPIFVESPDKIVESRLMDIAKKVSSSVGTMTSEQRTQMHVAGVMTNNFVYYVLKQVIEFTQKSDLPLEVLQPLLQQTLRNALDANVDLQTGPAKRGDIGTMQQHIVQLQTQPELKKLYSELSKMIYTRYHGKELEL